MTAAVAVEPAVPPPAKLTSAQLGWTAPRSAASHMEGSLFLDCSPDSSHGVHHWLHKGFSEVRDIRAPHAALNHWRVWLFTSCPVSLYHRFSAAILLLYSESCDQRPNKLPAPVTLSQAPLLRTHRGYSLCPGLIQSTSRSQRRCY